MLQQVPRKDTNKGNKIEYSEDIFKNQRKQIEEIMSNSQRKKSSTNDKSYQELIIPFRQDPNDPNNLKTKDIYFSLSDTNQWKYSIFDYDIVDSEHIPIISNKIKLGSNWLSLKELNYMNKTKHLDIRNILIKCSSIFNMSK